MAKQFRMVSDRERKRIELDVSALLEEGFEIITCTETVNNWTIYLQKD